MNICTDQSKDACGNFPMEVHRGPNGYTATVPSHPLIKPVVKPDEVEAISAMNQRLATFLLTNFQVTDG